MLTYFDTFCALLHLGGHGFSEMQYKVVFFLPTTIFQACSHPWFIKIFSIGIYYNDWTAYDKLIVIYLIKLLEAVLTSTPLYTECQVSIANFSQNIFFFFALFLTSIYETIGTSLLIAMFSSLIVIL